MKAILEFDLTNFEDIESHKLALNGHVYKIIIDEFFEVLRRKIKYEHDNFTTKEIRLLENLRDELNQIYEEHLSK